MKKIISAIFIILPMLSGASAYDAFAEEITVYMTIEKLTLGQGFIMAPTAVTVEEGTSVAQLIDMTMPGQYMHTGSVDDNLYVSAFNDIEEEINIPEYILSLIGEPTSRQESEWLSEFDYSNTSGWKFSVNNEFPSISTSDYKLDDGDVVRWQFSLYGYGSDLDEYAMTDKSELIRAVANGEYSEYALDVLTRLDSTVEEVNDAYTELYDDEFFEESGYVGANIKLTAEYVKAAVTEPQIAQVGGEWTILGLARSGEDIDKKYFDSYYERVVNEVNKKNGVLHERKYTEYARVALALAAVGKDPANVNGYDLVYPLTDVDSVMRQGTNGAAFALIAMDSCDYQSDAREKYLAEILSRQGENGGFTLGKNGKEEIDITAMSLIALANYKEREDVSKAIEKALVFISEAQQSDGGFEMFGEGNAESAVQVIVALTSLGVSLGDDRFVKNGKSILDYLLEFAVENGGFRHIRGGDADLMASEQALYAMAAAKRADMGELPLFDMEIKTDMAPRRAVLENIVAKTFDVAECIYD